MNTDKKINKALQQRKDIYKDLKRCIVLDENDPQLFEDKLNELLEKGYKMQTSSMGYVPDPYDCNYYMAVMVLERD